MHSFSRGVRFVWDSVGVLARNREALKFLLAYLLYADGVATVIVFSSVFAATTLGFETPELILLYMVVQITALIGAFGLARAVDTKGPKAVVMCSLVLWATVCVLAYFVAEKAHFWAVAVMAGLALGTVQAASRALYARFVPRGHETEYFGLYALVGKSSAVMGPLVFGAISSGMGSQRPAILAVGGFFAGGLVLLGFVREGRALV
jgi:UMF1 family MFS transporter